MNEKCENQLEINVSINAKMPQRWYIGKFVPLHWILFEIHTFLKVNKISPTPLINFSFIFQEIMRYIKTFYVLYMLQLDLKYLITIPIKVRVSRHWFFIPPSLAPLESQSN